MCGRFIKTGSFCWKGRSDFVSAKEFKKRDNFGLDWSL